MRNMKTDIESIAAKHVAALEEARSTQESEALEEESNGAHEEGARLSVSWLSGECWG